MTVVYVDMPVLRDELLWLEEGRIVCTGPCCLPAKYAMRAGREWTGATLYMKNGEEWQPVEVEER